MPNRNRSFERHCPECRQVTPHAGTGACLVCGCAGDDAVGYETTAVLLIVFIVIMFYVWRAVL